MEGWFEHSANVKRSLRERLFSAAEFDKTLADLTAGHDAPVRSLHVEITQQGDFPSFTFGSPPAQVDSLETVNLDNLGRATARVSLCFDDRADPESRQAARTTVSGLVSDWWRGDQRDDKGKILSAQYPELQRAFESAIASWSTANSVAVLLADIDHFKLVNDYRTEQEGDRLIAKFAALLSLHAAATAIVIRRGGDEFLVILRSPDPGVAVVEAARLRSAVEADFLSGEEPFEGPDQLGLSVGVAIVSDPRTSYQALETRADRALKPGGNKRRGRVSVEFTSADDGLPPPLPPGDFSYRNAAAVLALSCLATPAPFANAWLDAVSTALYGGVRLGRDPREVFNEVLEMVQPAWDPNVLMSFVAYGDTIYGQTALSPLDVVLAAAHGLGRYASSTAETLPYSLRYAYDGSWAKLVGSDGQVIADAGSETATAVTLPVVPLPSEPADSHRALLVSLGADPLNLPDELFYETVYVDDRPTAGGGLPDLWQAALARVVGAAARDPNIVRVIVVGNIDFGRETLSHLRAAERWSTELETADRLATKIAMPTTPIRRVGARIGGRVVHATGLDEAVTPLLHDLEEGAPVAPLLAVDPEAPPPRLRSRLDVDEYILGLQGGCRVPTASVAFPIALDVVRQNELPEVRDQSGRAVRELVDFRIHLTTPTVDPVPRFHADELVRLDEYFQTEFCAADGLFRKQLDAHDQFARVIDHLVDTVRRRGYTSRRAPLVVPHIPVAGKSLAPLGLVSVRTIARPMPGGTALDYSFTWRTVETLVGLPYSLYGSIRFAEYITDLVRSRLGAVSTAGNIRLGELSYIAHSLHLFLDEYAERIARRIVSDDTA